MTDSVTVVGAGQAAAQLAISLRQGGFNRQITLIGDEPYLPYQRPPLSKKFLSDRGSPDSLFLRPPSFWRDHAVDLNLDCGVSTIDLRQRRLRLVDGSDLDFGALVLATGTRARPLPLLGVDLAGVQSLRKIDDVRRLRPLLDEARNVVIIGGGYIGLEVAAVVRGEGRDVVVLEAEDRVLKRVTAPTVSAFFEMLHRNRGVDIRVGTRAVAIEGETRVTGVALVSGERLPADIVLIAVGARANDELAAAAGLACEDGILVDEFTRTNVAGLYAIGDCTRFPSRRFARLVRLESVQNAIDQAKACAAVLLGAGKSYDPVPWFWSDQYDIKLQIAGLVEGYDDTAMRGDPAAAKFSVEYRRAGRLIAVDAINDARAHMLARRRIAEETDPTVMLQQATT
jgi:3-phenylpropionate/trans-cinnamate dioxygenase ferredoxin reductase subunit